MSEVTDLQTLSNDSTVEVLQVQDAGATIPPKVLVHLGNVYRGKSAYEQAQDGGYTDGKDKFNEQLAKINDMLTTNDVVNNLTTPFAENKALSAHQGFILNREKVRTADYNSERKAIILYADTQKLIELAAIDATPFIKDGMVHAVSLDPQTQILTVTFNTDSGKESIKVDLAKVLSQKINVVPGHSGYIPKLGDDGQLSPAKFSESDLQKMDNRRRVISYTYADERDYSDVFGTDDDPIAFLEVNGAWRMSVPKGKIEESVPASIDFEAIDGNLNITFTAQNVEPVSVSDTGAKAHLYKIYKVVFEYSSDMKWVFKSKEVYSEIPTIIYPNEIKVGDNMLQLYISAYYNRTPTLMQINAEDTITMAPITFSVGDNVIITGVANIGNETYTQTITCDSEYNVLEVGEVEVSGCEILTKITHSELKALRDSGQLVPGQKYRITDYITLINAENRFSAEHPFDIIVTALSKDSLSAEASAIAHEGCTFFNDYDLSSWKLYYSIDNDFAEWGLTSPREGGWITEWGLLKYRTSTNDNTGKNIHLYSADDDGAYWRNKSITRTITQVITNINDIVAVAESYDAYELYLYHRQTGALITTLYSYESDDEGRSIFYDDNDYNEDMLYPVTIVSEGEGWDEDGMYYVMEVSGLSDLFDNYYGGNLSYSTAISYEGDYNDLYTPFDEALNEDLPANGRSYNKLFCTRDMEYYSISQQHIRLYQHEAECGRGVIYRMIDEFNNDFPYDFYNVGILDEKGYGYYTFSNGPWDFYINNRISHNLLSISLFAVKKRLCIAKLPTSCKNTRIYASNGFESISIRTGSMDNNIYIAANRVSVMSTAIVNTGDLYSNDIYMLGDCNFKVGGNFARNIIKVASSFTAGNYFQENLILATSLVIDSDNVFRCLIKGNGSIRTEDTRGNRKGGILGFADITLRGASNSDEVLKLQYDGTTGSAIGLTGLKIHGSRFWRGVYKGQTRTVVIPSDYTTESYTDLTIAANSEGEIKVYSEADLIA